MLFSATQSGRISHTTPSDVRRGIRRGRLAQYAEDFFYVVYPHDETKTQAARQAIEQFYREEMRWRREFVFRGKN